jgi:capsular exopolysaccharide synthesis family protein
MEEKRIPILNETFDIPLFLLVFRKSFIYFIIISILAGIGAFAYLRYTRPIFQASSVIQIKDDNEKTSKLLNIQSFYDEFNPNQSIELIRSKEFIKRVIAILPFEVSYFSQGTFLQTEQYPGASYQVIYRKENFTYYDVPIGIEFEELGKGYLYLHNAKDDSRIEFRTNEWTSFNGSWLKIAVVDTVGLSEMNEAIKKNSLFFIVNNEQTVLNHIISNLAVGVLSFEAQTIQITYTDFNAGKVADVVNTIATEFLKYDVEKKKESADKILDFIEKQSSLIYNELDDIEEQIILFRKQNNIKTEDEKEIASFKNIIEKVAKTESEIEIADIEADTYRRLAEYIEKNELSATELIGIIPPNLNSSILTSIINEIQSLIKEREKLMNNLTTKSFQIQSIEKQIANQKEILKEFLATSLKRNQEKKEYWINQLRASENLLLTSQSGNDIEYGKIQRLYNINIEFFNKILEKKVEYLVSQAGFVSQNIILENAIIPGQPISPRKMNTMIIAIVIIFVLSFFLLFVRYLFHNEVYSIQDIKNYTDVPIIGTIPSYHEKIPLSKVLVDIKPNSVFSEAFRNIRSNLEFIDNEPGAKIIALSSTISGEGKTFVALNLGGVYAFQGKKVILLDFDLRKPRVHKSFEKDNKHGISTLLIGKSKIEDCIHESNIKNMSFITAGPIPPNPSELIKNSKLNDLFVYLRERYDIIIVDTPPIGLVTDGLELYKLSDFQIYVLKSNYSKRVFIYNINHLFHEKKFTRLACVLNHIDMSSSSMFGSYSHHYGYGYYSYESKSMYQEDAQKYFRKGFFNFLMKRKKRR